MSEHRVILKWGRTSDEFTYDTYNREHSWSFDGGIEVAASAAPAYRGDPSCVDPEEAFVASLASCHMLTFLAIAARRRLVVDAYDDEATGFMEKNEHGRLAITRVVLRPRIRFGGAKSPSRDELDKLHEQAHRECFIANSVVTKIAVEPV